MGGRLPKMRSHQPKQCLCTCPVLPCNFAGPKNIPPNFFRYRPCKYYCAPSLFICITKWSQKFREEFRARGACQSNLCVCNFGFDENGWFYMCKTSSCIFFLVDCCPNIIAQFINMHKYLGCLIFWEQNLNAITLVKQTCCLRIFWSQINAFVACQLRDVTVVQNRCKQQLRDGFIR